MQLKNAQIILTIFEKGISKRAELTLEALTNRADEATKSYEASVKDIEEQIANQNARIERISKK